MDLPDERVRVHMAAQYDSELAYLDSELGRLLAHLEARGLLADTLIVVTSDHGEGFLEHGTLTHGHSLYQNEVHVPLVIYDPLTPVGKVVESPVSSTAVTPWLLGRLGGRLPEGLRATPELTALGPVVSELYGYKAGEKLTVIRQDGLKLTVSSTGRTQLHDLHADPEEREPLNAGRPADVTRLLEALNGWKEANPETIREARTLSESDREQLRMLGYAE
jgi:arylsulfatase A-like enzyme